MTKIGSSISEMGVVRNYFDDDGLIVGALLRNRQNENEHLAACEATRNAVDVHLEKDNDKIVFELPVDIWLKITNEAGFVEPYSPEAMKYVRDKVLLEDEYKAFRTVPDKLISHNKVWY